MFSKAVQVASRFTLPVVISSRTVRGNCRSSIGACIVVNAEGWVLTAAHLFGLIQQQERQALDHRNYHEEVKDFEHAVSSKTPHRKREIRHIKKPGKDSVCNHSVWWGMDGVQIKDVLLQPANDLALGRLEPFDAGRIAGYPVFKKPSQNYAPGRSLCRLGFSFHEITPTFDEERGAFLLPQNALPLPFFPLEGMLSRFVRYKMQGAPDDEPGMFIETSSPGLRGQSGGPIFDAEGVVWSMQSHTRHYPLGFMPQIPGRAKGHVSHQFLNVGVGVHVDPILKFLEQQGVSHQRAD